MPTLPKLPLPERSWVRIDTPVAMAAGRAYGLQARIRDCTLFYDGAQPDEADARIVGVLERFTVPYAGTPLWMWAPRETTVAIEDLGPDTQAGTVTALTALEAARPVQIRLLAQTDLQTAHVLPFAPTDAINSHLEYNGVTYRASAGDYAIAGATLNLLNPVIAAVAGEPFYLITA